MPQDKEDYITIAGLQTSINLYRELYGEDSIIVRHHINPIWSETYIEFKKSLGRNVAKYITHALNKYTPTAEHDTRTAYRCALEELVDIH